MKKAILVLLVLLLSFSMVFAADADRPKVAVVLSGGGAKGLAHIALLERIEQLGIPVDMVLGTSMGSLIGGLYCSGYSPSDITRLMKETNLTSLFTTIESNGYRHLEEPFDYSNTQFSISLDKGIMNISGFVDDYKILNCFLDAVGNVPDDIDFDDLPIPFRCIASNVVNGTEKIFDHGSVVDAMRSSMSIPLVFPPYEVDGELYVDGGLVNNMPIQLAAEMGFDIIIAEDVNGKFSINKEDYQTISGSFGSLFRVIVNNTINEQKKYATIMLVPDLRGIGILGFSDPDSVVERGLTEMEERAPELQAIADMFSEDQKVYKDPSRVGEYFTLFEERDDINYRKPNAELVREKSLHQSRVSVGFSMESYFYSFMGEKPTVYDDYNIDKKGVSFAVVPNVKLRLFKKNLWGSRFSLDTKLYIGSHVIVNPNIYFLFNKEEANTHVLGLIDVDFEMGPIVNSADRTLKKRSSKNATQFKQDLLAGFKITNERSFNIDFEAGYQFNFVHGPVFEEDVTHLMLVFDDENRISVPHATVSASVYKDTNSTGLDGEGIRFDFLFDGGMYRDGFKYKAGVGYSHHIRFGRKAHENNAIWYDAKAFTTRQPWVMRTSYIEYGGFDGMPGARFNDYYRDFIMGGIGYQRLIDSGLTNKYLIIEARIAYREASSLYSTTNSVMGSDVNSTNMTPFGYLFDDNSDLCLIPAKIEYGIGIGIGLTNSILGDIIFGVGFNNNLDLSFYIEMK